LHLDSPIHLKQNPLLLFGTPVSEVSQETRKAEEEIV